ncbi:hypothetical protein QV01_07365 [Gallibacterium genomosp. 3]|uniref:Lipoprotein n=1 Tax=Gallibacterium genomosp. 3 TaxID=505345 RepID=A0A1A7NPF7_9PAST|nr:hypothetical protein [Gallibacterium genomosp. 3]OBW91508.1 hypothetical protein QV01_07365 [Gallibacterium genomosp. 3]
MYKFIFPFVFMLSACSISTVDLLTDYQGSDKANIRVANTLPIIFIEPVDPTKNCVRKDLTKSLVSSNIIGYRPVASKKIPGMTPSNKLNTNNVLEFSIKSNQVYQLFFYEESIATPHKYYLKTAHFIPKTGKDYDITIRRNSDIVIREVNTREDLQIYKEIQDCSE